MSEVVNVVDAFKDLKRKIAEADLQFDQWLGTGDDWYEPDWAFDACFLQLLTIAEAIGLAELRKLILSEYAAIRESKVGLTEVTRDPYGEPYSRTISRLRMYTRAIESFFPEESHTKVTKDLLEIVRDIHYVITDKDVYGRLPSNENDVHIRIEGILKPVFPDLKNKPVLTKSIKNFQPDTGIPSIKTLIEYKFLARKQDAAKISDEVLADTRGYVSRDWSRFLYVIYETLPHRERLGRPSQKLWGSRKHIHSRVEWRAARWEAKEEPETATLTQSVPLSIQAEVDSFFSLVVLSEVTCA